MVEKLQDSQASAAVIVYLDSLETSVKLRTNVSLVKMENSA
jgi:hypothetical protein